MRMITLLFLTLLMLGCSDGPVVNDTRYTAVVEMIDGTIKEYKPIYKITISNESLAFYLDIPKINNRVEGPGLGEWKSFTIKANVFKINSATGTEIEKP